MRCTQNVKAHNVRSTSTNPTTQPCRNHSAATLLPEMYTIRSGSSRNTLQVASVNRLPSHSTGLKTALKSYKIHFLRHSVFFFFFLLLTAATCFLYIVPASFVHSHACLFLCKNGITPPCSKLFSCLFYLICIIIVLEFRFPPTVVSFTLPPALSNRRNTERSFLSHTNASQPKLQRFKSNAHRAIQSRCSTLGHCAADETVVISTIQHTLQRHENQSHIRTN